jgi:uncharacterized membrane protein YhfC
MISFMLFLSLFAAGLLEIFIPLILGLWLASKIHVGWRVFFVGAAMWLVALLVRTPLNAYASIWTYDNFSGATYIYLSIAIPSLTAGIFEEGSRWLAFRFLVKDHRLENGLMYGAGHGGIESILLVGLSVLSTAIAAYFYPQVFSSIQLDIIAATPPWIALVGLWERLAAMAFHIGMSVLVLESFRRKQPYYVGVAMAGHFFFNFSAVYASQWGLLQSEVVATAWSLVALWYMWTTWKSNKAAIAAVSSPSTPA